jgi:hypothetical protein
MKTNSFSCSAFGVPVSSGTFSGTEVLFGTPNASPVANTSDSVYVGFVTLTGLLANTEYHIHAEGTYTTSASGTGVDFGIAFDVAPAVLSAECVAIRTGTACAYGKVTSAGSIAASTTGSTNSQPFFYVVTVTTGAGVTQVTFQHKLFTGDVGTITIAANTRSHYYIVP